jgi:hypothetical protein
VIVVLLIGLCAALLVSLAIARSRRAPTAEGRHPDPRAVEQDVYNQLYGEQSSTVSSPTLIEPLNDADELGSHRDAAGRERRHPHHRPLGYES